MALVFVFGCWVTSSSAETSNEMVLWDGCQQVMLHMQMAAHHLASTVSSPPDTKHGMSRFTTHLAASSLRAHPDQNSGQHTYANCGRLQAFACVNIASATLPRSWVNKDASFEVLLGLSFTTHSKFTPTLAKSLSFKSKLTKQPAKNQESKFTTLLAKKLGLRP